MATVIVRSDVDEAIYMEETVTPDQLGEETSSLAFLERFAAAVEEADRALQES